MVPQAPLVARQPSHSRRRLLRGGCARGPARLCVACCHVGGSFLLAHAATCRGRRGTGAPCWTACVCSQDRPTLPPQELELQTVCNHLTPACRRAGPAECMAWPGTLSRVSASRQDHRRGKRQRIGSHRWRRSSVGPSRPRAPSPLDPPPPPPPHAGAPHTHAHAHTPCNPRPLEPPPRDASPPAALASSACGGGTGLPHRQRTGRHRRLSTSTNTTTTSASTCRQRRCRSSHSAHQHRQRCSSHSARGNTVEGRPGVQEGTGHAGRRPTAGGRGTGMRAVPRAAWRAGAVPGSSAAPPPAGSAA